MFGHRHPSFRFPHAAAALCACLALMMLTACADNPADDVTPARVSEPPMPPPAEGTIASSDPAQAVEPSESAVTYVINPENSKIEFTCSKVSRSHDGGFESFSGEILLPGDSPEGAALKVAIDTASVWTDTPRLTEHLKTPDFFDVQKYPQARFELTGLTKTDAGYDLSGNFTLHGVTKNITFPATIDVGEGKVSASSEFAINRFDFDIVYPGMSGNLIRREVVIRLDIEAEAAPA